MNNTNSPDSKPHAELLTEVAKYLAILRKRKLTVLIVMGLIVAMGFAYTSRQKPVFRATATVIIDRSPPRLLSGVKEVIELGSSNYWAVKDYLRTQYEIIRSREVAERAVDRLNLRSDVRFASAGGELPPGTEGAQERQDPVNGVLQRIKVEPLPDSQLVYVHAEDADGALARDLANAMAESYRDHNLESKKHIVFEAQQDLVKLVDRLRVEKEKAEEEVRAFEKQHSIGSLDNQKALVEQRLLNHSRQLDELEAKRIVLEARLNQLRQYKTKRSVFAVAYSNVLENPLIVSMKQRHVELKDKASELGVVYGEKHPKLAAVKKQIAYIERQLRREVRNQLQAVEDQFAEVVQTVEALQQRLDEAQAAERELARVQAAYVPLAQRRDEATKFYNEVLYRQTETTLTAQSTMNNVRIHDFATEPVDPIRPNRRLAMAVSVLLGLVTGIGMAFLREFMDNTVKDREDIEQAENTSFLGVMPHMAADPKRMKRYETYSSAPSEEDQVEIVNKALFIHYRPKSIAAERTRNLRTNLLFMSPEKPLRTILVTSPNPEEGKTTVSVNISIAMAQGGARTLLIDTDLRRPKVHRSFCVENETGLSNAVIGSEAVETYIQPSEVPNLDLLLCGPVPPDPTALLHTNRFREIMEQLRDKYDVVILDSPPVLPVTDAMITANHADGVVLVVKSGQTARDSLAFARHELARVNANVLGCVLNDHDVARKGYGHYKYYRHRYYRYGDAGDGNRAA